MASHTEHREVPKKAYQDVLPLDTEEESDLDNDPAIRGARDSSEVADHDHEILDEEEERETLLSLNSKAKVAGSIFSTRRSNGILAEKVRKDRTRRRRKHARREVTDGEGKSILQMEEGGPASDASSQASGSSGELDSFNGQQHPTSRVSPQDVPE